MEISISVWDDISIHALRKESDRPVRPKRASTVRFQSTLSVRRATATTRGQFTMTVFQSTLSVRRATLTADDLTTTPLISIHALRKESDDGLAIRSFFD